MGLPTSVRIVAPPEANIGGYGYSSVVEGVTDGAGFRKPESLWGSELGADLNVGVSGIEVAGCDVPSGLVVMLGAVPGSVPLALATAL